MRGRLVGHEVTLETRAKLSSAFKDKSNPKISRPCLEGCQCKRHVKWHHTEETKAILAAKCGRPQSPERKAAVSLLFKGRRHTAETIEKMRTVGIEKRYKTNLERYGDARGSLSDTTPERLFKKFSPSQDYLPQHPVKGILVDFYFPQTKTCVFVDGCYWHNCLEHFPNVPFPSNVARDREQDRLLSGSGYKVVRVWEHDLIRNAGPYR